jgi:hypothetical protein
MTTETFTNAVFSNIPNLAENTPAVIYTVASGKVAIVFAAQVSNTANEQTGFTMNLVKGGTVLNLCSAIQVPPNAALNPIAGKIVLTEGDYLEVAQQGQTGGVNSTVLDVVISIIEVEPTANE